MTSSKRETYHLIDNKSNKCFVIEQAYDGNYIYIYIYIYHSNVTGKNKSYLLIPIQLEAFFFSIKNLKKYERNYTTAYC